MRKVCLLYILVAELKFKISPPEKKVTVDHIKLSEQYGLISGTQPLKHFWTGAGDFDNDDNIWTWIDGDGSEVPQQMWNTGEPNNVFGGIVENCARFNAVQNLVDVPCSYKGEPHYPLCQFRTQQN